MQRYEEQLYNGQYEKAFNQLDDIKLLQKDRNRFLYLAEKGRAANLLGWYDSSNTFLNQADYFLEDHFKTVGDVTKSNLLNPMMETYLGEDFERFLVHFYKAINYLQLGNIDDAMVEARRISNENNRLIDATDGNSKKYSSDAFSLILQGIIFEKGNRINDAFISYRNAADLFLKSADKQLYGVSMPNQLAKDVLRTASQLGFTNEITYYETAFGIEYQHSEATNGELIIFWENGKAPIKQQVNAAFQFLRNNNQYYFMNTSSRQRYDLDEVTYNSYSSQLGSMPSLVTDLFRITLPYYQSSKSNYSGATVSLNGNEYIFEEGIDVNNLATATLQERQGKEIIKALTRLLVKKITETSAGAIAKAAATTKESEKKETEKTTEEKKKEQANKDRAEVIGNGVELLTKLFNVITEKADTRNWQGLPAYIHYARIPLSNGTNYMQIQFQGTNGPETKDLTVQSDGTLQIIQATMLQ
jgi:hypothetical protein